MTTRPSWAEPIVGELPWGTAGGAVAWTGGARAVALLRRHDGAPIERCALGGHAYVASVQSDGRIVWPTIDAGIRYWQPATGESGLLVPSPAVGGVRTRPDGLEFDPIVITEGPAFPRIRLDYTWAWSSGAAELCRRPASAEGQCFAEVEDRQRQAGAYPFSDLVRISIDGGRFDLHVPHPLMLAWAGEDLLVSTGAGRLLRFKDVAGNLA